MRRTGIVYFSSPFHTTFAGDSSTRLETDRETMNAGMGTVRFQCIVCRLVTPSVSQLHYHHMFCHTTEDLSLAVVSLQGLINVMDPAPGNGIIDQLFLESLTKFPQFYMLQTNPSSDTDYSTDSNNGEARLRENCMLRERQAVASKVIVKETDGTEAGPSGIGQWNVTTIDLGKVYPACRKSLDFTNISLPSEDKLSQSKWESEMSKPNEISDELFLRSVDGICNHFRKFKHKVRERNGSQKMSVRHANHRTKKSPKNSSKSLIDRLCPYSAILRNDSNTVGAVRKELEVSWGTDSVETIPSEMPLLEPYYNKTVQSPKSASASVPGDSPEPPQISPYQTTRISTDTSSRIDEYTYDNFEDLTYKQNEFTLNNNLENKNKNIV